MYIPFFHSHLIAAIPF